MSVAMVSSVDHPSLRGRALCALDGAPPRWLPCLSAIAVRAGDRVLVARPDDFAEAIVVGVLDGFAPRERPVADRGPRLALAADEAVLVEGRDGRPLVEVREGDHGPVVRLLSSDVILETEGKLRLEGASIELVARRGEAKIEASEDVVVVGEVIHLN
jgi:hypothetical protein